MQYYFCRALPGINAAAVGLIVAAVFQLGFKVQANSPFPDATVGIGKHTLHTNACGMCMQSAVYSDVCRTLST